MFSKYKRLRILLTGLLFLSGCGSQKTAYQREAEEQLQAMLDLEYFGYDFAFRRGGESTTSYSYEIVDFDTGKLTHLAVFYNSDGSLRSVSNIESFAIAGDENGFERYNLGRLWYVYKRDGNEVLKYDEKGLLRETFEVTDLETGIQLIQAGIEGVLANEALAWLSAGE